MASVLGTIIEALGTGSIPDEWFVLVLADRGLYAGWLFESIVGNGWHPFLRMNTAVKARAVGENDCDWVSRWVPTPGTRWQGMVEWFVDKKSRLVCTLLMQWQEGYEHPWVVLTDLAKDGGEYSLGRGTPLD